MNPEYFDEIHNGKKAHMLQTGQERRYCARCRSSAGHEPDCPAADVVSVGALLKQSRRAQKRAKETAARYLVDLQLLTGKLAMLRHENNKLRRKLHQKGVKA